MRREYILLAVLLTSCSPRGDQSGTTLAKREQAVNIAANFMKTGDTTSLRDAFSDGVLASYSPTDMINARLDMVNSLGEFQGTKDLHSNSATESHVTFEFEHGDMNFALQFDESGKITSISDETVLESERTAETSGQPTAMTDLSNLDALRASFNADSQSVRLVSLLSPT